MNACNSYTKDNNTLIISKNNLKFCIIISAISCITSNEELTAVRLQMSILEKREDLIEH